MSKWLRNVAEHHPFLFWIGSILILGEVLYKIPAVTFLQGNEWAVTLLRLSILLGTILMVREMYDGEYSMGFRRENFRKGFLLMMIPACPFMILNFLNQVPHGVYLEAVFTCVMCNLIIGFFEEVLVRGFLMGSMMRHWENRKHRIGKSIILSSLFFGALHIGNVFSGASLLASLFQVFYATAIGIAFGSVYARTKNIGALALIHGFVDLLGSMGEMTVPMHGGEDAVYYEYGITFFDDFINGGNGMRFIALIIVSSIFAIACGIFLVRKSKTAEITDTWRQAARP